MTDVAALVRKYYLDADAADAVADEIEGRRDRGAYDDLGVAGLAEALTSDLRGLTGDLHFSVVARPLTADEAASPPEHRWKHSMPGAEQNFGFERVEVRPGRVGVVTITSLVPLDTARATATAAMAFVQHASSLVLDLRRCSGGDPDLIAMLLSYLLGEHAVELTETVWRHSGEVERLCTDPSDVPFRFAACVPVYAVVGDSTASGGEALAYELQARERAAVVGQATIGAAHRVMQFEVASSMLLTVPSGETTNPITGSNWEGTGVVPSRAVDPDEDSLALAVAMAVEATRTPRLPVATDG